MEKKHTDKKNYLSVRIKWCALLAAGLIGVVLAEMWLVHIREMRSLAAPTLFTALFLMLAAAVHRLVLVPYRETRKIYEQFVMGYVMEDLFKVRYPFSPESEQAVLRLNEIIDRSNLIAISKKQAEYLALQNQINPHFLFNTLNTLKWIATLNHVTPVSHGIDALSSLLQSTLIKKDELIPFDDELRNLKNYCDIQQLRYAGRFEMEYQIEDAAGYWTVPRFILQPLVENSILHGTADEDDFVTITVRATVSENLLTIHISDTGCGFDPSAIKEKNSERFSGIGLSNVDERMRLHYGNEYGLTIESAPGTGTQCILRIPNEAIR